MSKRPERSPALWPVLALTLLLAWGCGSGSGEPVAEQETVQPATQTEEVPVVDVGAKLALADEFDGVADRVVSRCLSCSLRMDGSAEHAVQFAGYELLFCSAGCAESFAADPEAGILALVIPEGTPDPPETGESETEG
jgi:hypothetical protein